ncbi:MAG: aminopeptidase P N-terminal domain-containing protein, partial [Saprospiraceae bacterium]
MHFRSFESPVYVERRKNLLKQINNGIIVFLGNQESPMNYRDNTYRFRQDSTFLYYFGIDVPGLAAIIDAYGGDEVIFGNELTIDDVVWTGTLPTIDEMANKCGVSKVMPYDQLAVHIRNAQKSKRNIHFLPPYRHDNLIRMSEWLSIPSSIVSEMSSLNLIKAVAAQRSIKDTLEIIELDKAATITANM